MKVILFGASGMVGQAVLLECLDDPAITWVEAVGRSPTGVLHPKLREIIHDDLWNYAAIEARLAGFDACFFCLGVSTAQVSHAEYERVNYDLPVAAAQTLARLNPSMTFTYVSGAGTDSTEKGRVFWARVKGRTENALRALPFKAVYLFRPGVIEPLRGVRSKTPAYRTFYRIGKPLLPIARRLFPRSVLTSVAVGRAMIALAKAGAPSRTLESKEIYEVAAAGANVK